jgi:hypothetical protein
MRNAQYLRGQVALCLEMARNMADPHSAEIFRAEAARYRHEAEEAETVAPLTSEGAPKP